ncbi:hypothetical protein VTN77DRAFT_5700 [Rasamsonia byssochlamydoides]|uniref:uncharacterized protein n=1 Tax=Rasamsonia byssochlamydoides TaxID=89139 RepID=UPI0037427ACA
MEWGRAWTQIGSCSKRSLIFFPRFSGLPFPARPEDELIIYFLFFFFSELTMGMSTEPAPDSSQAIALYDVIPEEHSYDGGSESEGDIPPPERRPYKTKLRRFWLLPCRSRSRKGSFLARLLRQAFLGLIFVLGILKFLSLIWDVLVYLYPDDFDERLDAWGFPVSPVSGFSHWSTNGVQPVACHSHNDYWREVPLRSAVDAGCIGVEADVWLSNDDLYVGHTVFSLDPERTLRSLYVDPLFRFLEKRNTPTRFQHHRSFAGVFAEDPSQTLVLLIDFKSDGELLWDYVYAQLEPLRTAGYLSYFNGEKIVPRPVTVVVTGNAPFHRVLGNSTYRDIFYDAPLDQLESPAGAHSSAARDEISAESADPVSESEPPAAPTPLSTPISGDRQSGDVYNYTNSYYASVDFGKTIGRLQRNRFSQAQLDLIRAQIRAAHQRGLKVRYWGTPGWPRGLRNHVWHVLIREGVDVINVDDLWEATRQDWRKHRSWWS